MRDRSISLGIPGTSFRARRRDTRYRRERRICSDIDFVTAERKKKKRKEKRDERSGEENESAKRSRDRCSRHLVPAIVRSSCRSTHLRVAEIADSIRSGGDLTTARVSLNCLRSIKRERAHSLPRSWIAVNWFRRGS